METELALSAVASGAEVEVVRFASGEGFRQKILSLGIRPGSTVSVQSFSRRGPLVLRVDGSRIAVGRGLADRIFVRPVERDSAISI